MEYLEFAGKTVDDAITEALIQLETTSDKIEYEVVEEGSSGIFGIFAHDAKIRVRKKECLDDTIRNFMVEILEKMEIYASPSVEIDEEEKLILIDVKGEDTSDLIGKRGQTLDALQYLTSMIANRGDKDYVRLTIDTCGYRDKRRKALQELAQRISKSVLRTG